MRALLFNCFSARAVLSLIVSSVRAVLHLIDSLVRAVLCYLIVLLVCAVLCCV